MNPKRNSMIEKIKKLLAASHDTANGNEAAVAGKLAEKLMEKHAIDMAALDEHEKSVVDPLGETSIKVGRRAWHIKLAWILGSHCKVSVLRCVRYNGVFAQAYGHQSDVEVWQYLYGVARREIERLTKEYSLDARYWDWKKDKYIVDRKLTSRFRLGCVEGLSLKLYEARQQQAVERSTETALVLQSREEKAQAYMASKNPSVGIWKTQTRGSEAGRRAGRNINLSTGIEGSDSKQIGGA
jgi:hypothetical protein